MHAWTYLRVHACTVPAPSESMRMQSSDVLSSGTYRSTSDVFVAGASGVAALDTPQSSQTKSEIRNIVSEIAELSASQLPLSEFLSAVLPRICNAMGASAAALWQCHIDSRCELIGSHRLPELIVPVPGENPIAPDRVNHSRILGCVAAEGSAILVPPKSVRMTTERPTNPLEDCLLVVPIKIDDRFEMLLEVIQTAGGGPAAQRGYLRFVAQMADLLSDFLRRTRLRQYAQRAAYVDRLQATLLAISSASEKRQQFQTAASGLADLLGADLVLIATKRRRIAWRSGCRVCAISHVPTFDSRSEIVLTAQRLIESTPRSDAGQPITILSTVELTREQSDDLVDLPDSAQCAHKLRELLNCHYLALMSIGDDAQCQALMALDVTCDLALVQARAMELSESFQTLLGLQSGSGASQWRAASPAGEKALHARPARSLRSFARTMLERWTARGAMLLLFLAVVCFPAPDSVPTTAVLESADKELYFAPGSATIERVFVDTHQSVKKGEPLIQLVDAQLRARFEELQGQKLSSSSQLQFHEEELKRGGQPAAESIGLYGRIDQLKINLQTLDEQLAIVKSQIDQLTIRARRDATVTSWDTKNQLNGRPVSAGQLLLTTYQPNAPWQLRVSIPERQLGRLREAMAGAREGLPVQFSMSSHPSDVRQGRLVSLSDQLVKNDEGVGHAIGIVAIDGNTLPTKTDGAIARATIACGRTITGWLAVRDAYREASAWWRLNW